MLYKEIIAIYSKNNMEPINILYGQHAELLNFEECGT
jgi:hypothetical protein